MGSRRKARILAFQALFSWEFTKTPLEELIQFPWLEKDIQKTMDKKIQLFASFLISGTIENIEQIDSIIQNNLENWNIYRLSKTDLSILRMSVYTLLYQKDIPYSVTIDEAIDIAKEFGNNDSYRFINGVLDGIRKEQELHEK